MSCALTNLQKLPTWCYAVMGDGCEPVVIRRGAAKATPGMLPIRTAMEMNLSRGVSPAQVEAMKTGVTLGWDQPGADPDHWAEAVGEDVGETAYTFVGGFTAQVTVIAPSEEVALEMARKTLDTTVEWMTRQCPSDNVALAYDDVLDLIEEVPLSKD